MTTQGVAARDPDAAPDVPTTAFRVALAGIAGFAAALASVHIGRAPLWRDEAVTSSVAQRSLGDVIQVLLHREGNMGLYFLTAHFWVKLGTSEAWLRSLSVVFAVLAVVATALTIELILGRRAAFARALLLGTNPFFSRVPGTRRASTALCSS